MIPEKPGEYQIDTTPVENDANNLNFGLASVARRDRPVTLDSAGLVSNQSGEQYVDCDLRLSQDFRAIGSTPIVPRF